jgi:hypothetical protein
VKWSAAIAVAVVVSAACMIPGIRQAVSLREPRAEVRYGSARKALQSLHAGSVGYLTSGKGLAEGDSLAVWRFHQARFALAPVLLLPETEEKFLLVDVADPQQIASLLRTPGLHLAADLGEGLAIVEQGAR